MFIVIGGATASGKSAVAVKLAKEIDGEIISADSMQIYRKMDVGTAKITEAEMQSVPHYMIDIVDPWKEFSLAEYAYRAKEHINDIISRKKVPIVCGGTGLYINSLIYDYNLSSFDKALRESLMMELAEKGIDYMYDKLLSMDPLAINIHKNNHKRVVRALEAIICDGKSILDKEDKKKTNPHHLYAIDVERADLYKKIDDRVDVMFSLGLEEEVKGLIENYNLTFEMQSMQAIGYKEFKEFFENKIDKEELKKLIKQHSRNYAKRQITWFKRIETCQWLKNDNLSEISAKIKLDYNKNKANL